MLPLSIIYTLICILQLRENTWSLTYKQRAPSHNHLETSNMEFKCAIMNVLCTDGC